MIPVQSQAGTAAAVPSPPGTFLSGRFAVFANGESLTPSQCCQKGFPRCLRAVGPASEAVESEDTSAVPSQCPHQCGLCFVGHGQCPGHLLVEGLRDEGTSSILHWYVLFCHASCVAGDCERQDVGQPDTGHERMGTLHSPPRLC